MTQKGFLRRWKRIKTFGIGLTAVLLITSSAEQDSTKPQIVFVSSREDRNSEIYVMDSDGGNVRRLTFHPAIDTTPSWSPDGKQIAFMSDRDRDFKIFGAINSEIYVMDSDGKNVRRLTHHLTEDAVPCWSPDGKQIVFASLRDGRGGEIYVMNADGSNLRNLTQSPTTSDWAPAWSPDGRYIAFSSFDLDGGKTDIHVIDTDGKNLRNLTPEPIWAHDQSPCWSPDGRQIAFSSNRSAGSNVDIYVVDIDGGNLRRLTHHPAQDWSPCWSSDGKQIVFTSHRDGGNSDIYAVDSDGRNPKRLTDHPQADEWPRWVEPVYALSVSVSRAGKLPSIWGRWKAKP